MKNIFEKAFNKGVPNSAVIEFPLQVIFDTCNKKKEFEQFINKDYSRIFNNILKICDVPFLNWPLYLYCEVNTDNETLEKRITISRSIVNVIAAQFLDCMTQVNNTRLLHERLDELKKVKTVNDLQDNFKLLYQLYNAELFAREDKNLKKFFKQTKGCSYIERNMIKNMILEHFLYNSNVTLTKESVEYMLKSYSQDMNLDIFIKQYINFIEKLFEKREEINEYLLNDVINLDCFTEKDLDKIELLITLFYLDLFQFAPEDKKQDYLYYISAYFLENGDKLEKNYKCYVPKIYLEEYDMGSRKIHSEDYLGDFFLKINDLYEMYKNILVENPNLRIIDFTSEDFKNMTLDEVNLFMEEYFKDELISWEIFDDVEEADREIVVKLKERFDKTSDKKEKVSIKNEIDKFMEKKRFFDSSDPYRRLLGKNSFDGYIGYVYSNGKIVLEKFFDNYKTGKVAKNKAIYVMNISEFEVLTRLSKTDIIAHKLCKRFIHKGNWQERVLNEIKTLKK